MESVLIKVGGWLSALFPAAIGSALSIFLGADKMQQLSNFTKFTTFMFGVVLGHHVGGAAIEYWQINALSLTASSIQISVGFMGMAALAEAKIQIPIAITALRKKWLGE
jgi:hypothetical protein